ncbi:(deoxy)nucleoside triphosphate pyrophosphohydrolase [Paenibacillus psychroresistens]|uniref:8-oxo-dGTP diphosphatase n=1 Tax=Paenibacillus psychroresistens TaxID=1778678 RepID=A0A6B8RJA4_9BACL|nr:(deoxy)nucleoside triphosphate pyrophosphohydrolase [Paenibacillus psychroresistens]QGQ95814.1 (deoxy)nucleoside triphosphate pyrophosphohydrolase [Paenibacillus psychroresistens]
MKQIDVVAAVILNEQNEVLCALRSVTMSLPGLWEFPGGKIEQGEDPHTALIREVKEELRCVIEVGEKITETVHEYPAIKVRLISYFAKVISGIPQVTEHESLVYQKKNELLLLEWAPADIPTVQILIG